MGRAPRSSAQRASRSLGCRAPTRRASAPGPPGQYGPSARCARSGAMDEPQADLRAKRALHYCITTLVCITITVLSVILVIWPHKPLGGDPSSQHWKKAIPCHFALTFFGSWESYIEHDASRCRATTTSCHDHALVRPWSRTYRKLKPKERAIVSNARNLLAAHAATPSQTFLLDTAACDTHLNSFAPPVNDSLRRWFRDASTSGERGITSHTHEAAECVPKVLPRLTPVTLPPLPLTAARRSELCRLGFLHARGGVYLDADLQPRHPGSRYTPSARTAPSIPPTIRAHPNHVLSPPRPTRRRTPHARGGLGGVRRRRGSGLGRPQPDERPPRTSQLACADT